LVLKPKTTNEGKTTMTRPKLKDDTVTLRGCPRRR
jgi:hypothetical protein